MLLISLFLAAAAQAQFIYTTDFTYVSDTGFSTPSGPVFGLGLENYTGTGGAVTIPDSYNGTPIVWIMPSAFYGCSSLTSVTIPNSIAQISGQAFWYCGGLTQVTIPASVSVIYSPPFEGCYSLTQITVDPQNPYFCGVAGVLFNKNQTLLVEYPAGLHGSYTIPDNVTSIGNRAFAYCSNLTNISLPDSMASLGDSAFDSCSSLAGVTIPDSVASIGDYAFEYCRSLTSITIPSNITSIGYSTFYGCTGLTNVTLPSGVTSIGKYAFEYCISLTSITIPSSVTSIDSYAFAYCSSLTSITIPNSVTNIGSYMSSNDTFYNCSHLTNVYFQGNAPTPTNDTRVFSGTPATIYYLPGTTGWGPTFCGRPTAVYGGGALLAVQAGVTGGGTVSGGGAFYIGTDQQISATAATGWRFSQWDDGNTDNPRTVTIPAEGATYTAIFVQIPVITSPVVQGSDLTLNWTAQIGKTYTVEYRADLTSGAWTTVTNLTATQAGMSLTLPVTGTQGYYRLGVAP